MIDALLAKKFIERITQYTDYNINIMDEKGIIIASRNASRIGTFHKAAFQIIQGGQDIVVIDHESIQFGMKKGVNMAIYYKKKKEGVIGITGEPAEVRAVALVVKMAVEVMLEHELDKYERMKRRNLKEQLLNIVLYEEKLQREDWMRFTERLKLKENIIRIPILISVECDLNVKEKILDVFRSSKGHSSQDLICLTRNDDILLYKALDGKIHNLMSEYKYEVGDAISDGLRYMRSLGYVYAVYIGSFQNKFSYYRMGFEHCLWLKKNMKREGSFYFYDYSGEYFMSILPFSELQVVYDSLEEFYGEKFAENFMDIIEALQEANYNLNEASKRIHVHRNTLVYRLDKIREALDVDPLGNSKDREFVNGFYYFLKRNK